MKRLLLIILASMPFASVSFSAKAALKISGKSLIDKTITAEAGNGVESGTGRF